MNQTQPQSQTSFRRDLAIYGAIGGLTYILTSDYVPQWAKFAAGLGLAILIPVKGKLSPGKDQATDEVK